MTRLTISTKLFTSLTDVLALLLNKAFNTRWPNYLCGCWMSGRMIYLISLSDIERVWEVCHVLAEFHYHCCDLAHITFPGVESCFKLISCSLLIIRKWVSFLDFHNKLLQLLTLSPSYISFAVLWQWEGGKTLCRYIQSTLGSCYRQMSQIILRLRHQSHKSGLNACWHKWRAGNEESQPAPVSMGCWVKADANTNRNTRKEKQKYAHTKIPKHTNEGQGMRKIRRRPLQCIVDIFVEFEYRTRSKCW